MKQFKFKNAHVSLFPIGTELPVLYVPTISLEAVPLSAPKVVMATLAEFFKFDECFLNSHEVLCVFVGIKEIKEMQDDFEYLQAITDCISQNKLVWFFGIEANLLFLKNMLLLHISKEEIYYHCTKDGDDYFLIHIARGKKIKMYEGIKESLISLC